MSYVTIHKVPEVGAIESYAEAENAWLGAMYIWESMYLRYVSKGVYDLDQVRMNMHRNMQSVWDLAKDEQIPLEFRIVLTTTFDKVMVRRADLPRVIGAFSSFRLAFGGDNNLGQQQKALRELLNDETCYAVCWTQTSVADDIWMVYEQEKDDHRWYDLSRDTGHWFLELPAVEFP